MGEIRLRKRNNLVAVLSSTGSTIWLRLQEHVSQLTTNGRISSLLRRDVVASWETKSIHEIKKRDVSDLVSLIAQRNAVASHRMLKTLKTFFRWCVGRAVIDFCPAEGISSNYREVRRDRVLTDNEPPPLFLLRDRRRRRTEELWSFWP